MAKIRMISRTKKVKAKVKRKQAPSTPEVSIPSEPSELAQLLSDYSILVHGEKKIGKTSMFAQENSFFMMFDPEQKALAIRQRQIPDWATCLAYIKMLEKKAKLGKLDIETIVIDGADIMFTHCFAATCAKLCITHPSDEND